MHIKQLYNAVKQWDMNVTLALVVVQTVVAIALVAIRAIYRKQTIHTQSPKQYNQINTMKIMHACFDRNLS